MKNRNQYRAAFHNLGCKVNSYETSLMAQKFMDAGYRLVPFEEEADVYVINTCTVTNIADRKSRQMLRRAKKRNPQALVVAVGCYVQTASPEENVADLWIGNNHKAEVVELVEKYLEDHSSERYHVEPVSSRIYADESLSGHLSQVTEKTRVSLKIQDGCDQFCSYCVIPYARGRVRSKRPEEILKEVRGLTEHGYQEIVLTGIHLSSYGMDFPQGEPDLKGIIRMLNDVSGVKRIRLGSLEPRFVTEEFCREFSGVAKLCPHFHLSLQSGCDETLKRMNRRYTGQEYREKCALIRKYFRDAAITTDVIVGFPGETEEEFSDCRDFVRDVGFARMHVFKYSARRGTKAATMKDQVPEPIKAVRSDELLALDREMREKYMEAFHGKTAEVLFEEKIESGGILWQVGYTANYLRAAVASEEDLYNRILPVRLTEGRIFAGGGENSEIMLAERIDLY